MTGDAMTGDQIVALSKKHTITEYTAQDAVQAAREHKVAETAVHCIAAERHPQ